MADEFRIPSAEELEKMRNVDVRTVDKATLVDIKDIVIDPALPRREDDFFSQADQKSILLSGPWDGCKG